MPRGLGLVSQPHVPMATCSPIELRPVLLQGVSQLCRSVRIAGSGGDVEGIDHHLGRLIPRQGHQELAPQLPPAVGREQVVLRWVPLIGQFRPLKTLTLGRRNRIEPQCRPRGEFCLPERCVALHGSTSRGSGPG